MDSIRRGEFWFFVLPALLVLVGCSQSPSATQNGDASNGGSAARGNPNIATAVANNRTDDGRKMVRVPVFSGDVNSLDPAAGTSNGENRCISQIFDTLVQYKYLKRPLQLEPCLLETMPDVTHDGRQIHFKLQPGIRFHDDPCFPAGTGRELVADDVLYSWKRLADPDVSTNNWKLLKDRIVGLDEYRARLLEERASNPEAKFDYDFEIAGLKKVSDYEFTVVFNQPTPEFVWLIAKFPMSIVPREAIETYDADFGSHPVGTGPFTMDHWSRNANLILERNPNYREEFYPTEYVPDDKIAGRTDSIGQQLPLLDRVEVIFYDEQLPMWLDFRSRRLGFTTVPAAFQDETFDPQTGQLNSSFVNEGITHQPVQLLDFIFVGFNMLDPLLGIESDQGRYLRQAISLAIDWEEYNRRFHNGRCTVYDGMIPPGLNGHPQNGIVANGFRGPDLAKASELLAKAGFPAGGGLPEIDYFATGDPPGPEIAEMIAKHLARIGVKIRPRLSDFSTFMEQVDQQKAPMFSFAWVSDYPDAENNLALFYGPNQSPGRNRFNYTNPEYDQMYDRIRLMSAGAERTELIESMRDRVIADAPFAGSMARVRQYLANPELKNLKASDVFHNWFKYLDVE